VSAAPAEVVLERGPIRVAISLQPFGFEVRRGGRRLVHGVRAWCADGQVHDQFVQLTEGVIAAEERETRTHLDRAVLEAEGEGWVEVLGHAGPGREVRMHLELLTERVLVRVTVHPAPLRVGLDWERSAEEAFTGLGARHGEEVDQAGRRIRLGADRRYTGPDCPADMLEVGGIPQGDYVPVPWVLASRGYALWVETGGDGVEIDLGRRVSVSQRSAAGPFALHLLTAPSPAAQLRRHLRITGMPALLPEWATGTGRAATSTSTRPTSRTTSKVTPGTTSRSTRS